MTEPDYSVDDEMPDDDALDAIASLATDQLTLEESIESAEKVLKDLRARHREISEKKLPEAMAEVGLKKFTLQNGKSVEIKDDWKASITGKHKPFVMNWLRENGHDDIIKTTVVTEFNKGEDNTARALMQDLQMNGFRAHDDVAVNTGTFKSLCKELSAEGVDLPLSEFGVYIVRKSIIE